MRLVSRSRIALAVVVVVVLAGAVGIGDYALHYGKAYAGVTIGGLDVSGMTQSQIVELLNTTYGEQLAQGSATVYASEEAQAAEAENDESLAEQQTAEEEAASRTTWQTTADELGASLPSEKLAAAAVSVGRGEEGLAERVDAARNGREIGLYVAYDDDALEEFAATLDLTLGQERVDYGFEVVDGTATLTEGYDGVMVDRDVLAEQFDQVFLFTEGGSGSFVAVAVDAPVRIDEAAAQEVCDAVNAALSNGVRLVCNDGILELSAAEVGEWVVGEVEESGDGYALVAHVDEALAKPSIVSFAMSYYEGDAHAVSFDVDDDGEVSVTVEGSKSIPLASEAVSDMEAALFGEGDTGAEDGVPVVTVTFGECEDTMPLDEAIDLGVVEAFSSYTTTYSTGSSATNRNTNIAQAAEYLTNSVVAPGESWSFNDTCGERTEERGFVSAGAIVEGEYSDDVGGGICQVATTVFNAIYIAGLPITERHNHTLYISSYPVGRDAAVNWPDLDLVWENDTDSSILLSASCGEGSITITLYGVDPGYEVSTVTGDWEEGEEYSTVTEVDETLSPGTSYVETSGTNGRRITITRTVTDADGNVVSEDTFTSSYGAIDEVVVVGPDAEAADEQEEESVDTESSDESEET